MSDFRPCPTCSRSISAKAAACPHCGHQLRAPGGFTFSDPLHKWGCIIIVGLIAFMFIMAVTN